MDRVSVSSGAPPIANLGEEFANIIAAAQGGGVASAFDSAAADGYVWWAPDFVHQNGCANVSARAWTVSDE